MVGISVNCIPSSLINWNSVLNAVLTFKQKHESYKQKEVWFTAATVDKFNPRNKGVKLLHNFVICLCVFNDLKKYHNL